MDTLHAQIRAERPLHTGRRFDYVELDVLPPEGEVIQHQGVRHRGAAVIVPVLETDDGLRVLLIQNDRPITGRRLWEVPAGMRDPTPDGAVEDPGITAAREVIEETGYRAERLVHLSSFFPTPGITDEMMHLYAALELEHVGQQLEHGESITVHPVDPTEALGMIDDGRIIDAKTIIALLLAQRRGLLGPMPGPVPGPVLGS